MIFQWLEQMILKVKSGCGPIGMMLSSFQHVSFDG